MKTNTVVVALLGVTLSSSVLAQTSGYNAGAEPAPNPSWYIMPTIDSMYPDSGFGVGSRANGVGLRFGKPISENWDVQIGANFSRVNTDSVNYHQNNFGADALYLFSRSSFRPFLLLGVAAEYNNVDRQGVQVNSTSPAIKVGLGAQISLNEQWSIQGDVRRAHSYLRGNDFGIDRGNTSVYTLGLSYAFDAPVKSRSVARVQESPVYIAPVVAPAPAPVPVPMTKPVEHFQRITLSSTELFDFDKSDLRMPQPKLDELADMLVKHAEITNVNISGYTDHIGSKNYNMKLSQRRAAAVVAYLTSKNVDASRLNPVAMGESNPVVECTDKKRSSLIKCLEPNRRVEVADVTVEQTVQ